MSLSTILAFVISMAIYALICFYIGYNGWAWLKTTKIPRYKKTYIIFITALSLTFFAGRLLPFQIIEVLGGFWVAIVGYSLILIPVANLFHYALKKKKGFWIGTGVLSIYLFILIYGSYNAWNPVVRAYEIEVDKSSEQENLRILMASDFHLGSIVGKTHVQRFVNVVDEVKPDIILIPGDLIDDYIEPYLNQNMGDILKNIDAPLGVYAVLGNHDYYGNDTEIIVKEMEKIGIEMLLDEQVSIQDQFILVGRKDRTDKKRMEMTELLKGLDTSKPVIMLDHQPYEFDIARDNGIDIHLAGHTHRGQLFPANVITSRMYENDWGYLQKDTLHSFVSSGFGTWGPPLRIGSRSEVMVIDVKFTGR